MKNRLETKENQETPNFCHLSLSAGRLERVDMVKKADDRNKNPFELRTRLIRVVTVIERWRRTANKELPLDFLRDFRK